MLGNSYADTRRYLEVSNLLAKATPHYFTIRNSDIKFIPHKGSSLFADQLPVDANILAKISDPKCLYAVSHKDGNIYVQLISALKKFMGSEITDGNILVAVDQFRNIKSIIKNSDDGKVIHLHVHQEYSSLDGMQNADSILRRCKQLGMSACGITDHGTLAGVIPFYKAAKKYGIKPIIGEEFYLDDDRNLKGLSEEKKKGMKKNKEGVRAYMKEHRIGLNRHLCLFAMNTQGLKNLYKLSSIGFVEGFYKRPRIDWETLEKYNEGLIATTACAAGIISAETDPNYRMRNLKRMINIFGTDRLYLEVMLIQYEPQPKLNDELFQLSDQFGIPVICSSDAHYTDPDVYHLHHHYMKIGSGFSYGEGDNYLKTHTEYESMFNKYFSHCHYKWDRYSKALKTCFDLADKCNVEIELGKFKIPMFDLSKAIVPALPNETDVLYLKRRAVSGFKNRIATKVKTEEELAEYKARFIHELKIFIDAGYVNYLLIVLDMIDFAKQQGRFIVVRGSAAGSLLCYCLEMTQVEPIKRDLLFERFVSPLRAGLVDKSYQSPPDIDVDYPDRDEIIEYAKNKYGKDCVAVIATYNRSQMRQAIKDMANVTGFMSFTDANKVTAMIPKGIENFEDAIEESPDLKEWYNVAKNREWVDKFIIPILGLVGHQSKHAAGIVIAPGDITDFMPIQVTQRKKEDDEDKEVVRDTVTQFEGESIEEVGLLKFDILRVRTLECLKVSKDLIHRRKGLLINFPSIDLDNPKWYKGFLKKDISGIFQLDTRTADNLIKNIDIENFEDLTAFVSLVRPGTAGPGLDIVYCERKKGQQFEYDHPLLQPILKNTHGIPIYQEQVMKIVNQLGGMSLVEADKFRKMMKKKDLVQMSSYRERFLEGAVSKGVESRAAAMSIWEKVVSWSRYGFTKAHAAAYAQVSVWSMILKQNFPLEFFVGWLENPKDKKQIVRIYKDILLHKIPLVFPNVNKSKFNFTLQDDVIIWALKSIKYVGEEAAKEIALKAPYKDMADFVERVRPSKRVVDPLIFVEAFPWFQHPRDAANAYYAVRSEATPPQFLIDDKKYWNKKFCEYAGFYKSDPIDVYSNELEKYGVLDTKEAFDGMEPGESAKLAGYVTEYRTHMSKRGMMAMFTIEVDLESVRIIAWSSFYGESALRTLDPKEVIGKFVFVFGTKGIDNRGDDQIQLGDLRQDIFEVLDT